MKRKLICAFILSILCVIMAMGVAAEITCVPTSNSDTGAITVTGNTGTNSSGYVFVIITDTSTTADEIIDDETLAAKAYTVGQCISGEDGSFTIGNLRLAEEYESGSYNCIVYTAGGNQTVDFTYESPYVVIVEKFKETSNSDAVEEFVGDYSSYLTISEESKTKLDKVKEKEKESVVYLQMWNNREGVTDLDDVIAVYETAITNVYNALPADSEGEDDDEEGGDEGDGGNGDGGGGSYDGGSYDSGSDPVVVPIVDNITPKEEKERFSDLAGYAWAKSAIYKLAESGVIAGYPDGRFGPGELLTREQVVVMLVNAYQKATPGDISVFADVKDGAWYADYISYAVGSGMIAGMGDGSFGVGLQITRQDFAVMAYNAMGASYTPNGTANMNDIDTVSGYARQAVEALVEMGVLSGDDNGNVRPKDYTTRAEAAVILSKLR